ncbi:MAG: flavin-dependent oxidoreductase [Pseudomonadota bacterium]
MHVLIVGGGIGGLTTALALHARRIACTVCEQAPELRELGVGINTLPHAIKELAGLGLLDALDGIGIRTSELIYKTARGQAILRQPRGIEAGFAFPQFSIHRGKLQRLLLDAVRARLGARSVLTGHRLSGFTQNRRGVDAVFESADGPVSIKADVMIGADGIHSAVRRRFRGAEGPPSWNGILMWRGATWWPPFLSGSSMIIAGGMKAKVVLYPIFNSPERPGETLMNWVICAKLGDGSTPIPGRDDWSRQGTLKEVMAHVEGVFALAEVDLPALIAATPENYVYPMCDREPLRRWTRRRVTLLGDAAHPMYPVGSNGASQAILDAVCLADCLAAEPPSDALHTYESIRRPATTKIVRANRKGGPERVIDLVEKRAPLGFETLDQVASEATLKGIVGDYQSMAGFERAEAR